MTPVLEWVLPTSHPELSRVPPLAPEEPLVSQLWTELRWSVTRPWTWLSGVAVNLVLSLVWLVAVPLTGRPHRDWAIVVGTYFAVFILADVTTTNVLGADARRVRASFGQGLSLARILLVKNLTLLLIVGLPTLIVTAIITVNSEDGYRLVLTLPGVALPILIWLGVGNLASVLLPVAVRPLRQRWHQRRRKLPTARWLLHLALPYALLNAVLPVSRIPGIVLRHLPFLPHTVATRGGVLCAVGAAVYLAASVLAIVVARLHTVRIR